LRKTTFENTKISCSVNETDLFYIMVTTVRSEMLWIQADINYH